MGSIGSIVTRRHVLRGHSGPIAFLCWSPDDTKLATCGEGGRRQGGRRVGRGAVVRSGWSGAGMLGGAWVVEWWLVELGISTYCTQ